MKVALIGCGRIGKRHIEVINNNLDLTLVAACDLIFSKCPVPGYVNYDVMIQTHNPDIISVCVEAGNHAKIVCDIAKYGKHIIVEKPIALRLEDADAMIEACDKHGCKLFVVKQNRYNKPIIKLKEALDKGRFGKLVIGTIRLRWCRTQEYFDMDAWRGTWEQDGGVFASQASHHVDMLRWLMGDVKRVYAISKTRLLDIEVDDTGIANIEFKNGALGLVEATNAARPENLEGSISVLGEHGSVVIGGKSMNKLITWQFDHEDEMDKTVWDWQENPPDIYGFGHARFYENVIANIRGEKSRIIDGLDARKTLELITAIYQSNETKKEVYINFDTDKCRLGKK